VGQKVITESGAECASTNLGQCRVVCVFCSSRFIILINFDLDVGAAIKESGSATLRLFAPRVCVCVSLSLLSALLFTQVTVRKGCTCRGRQGDAAAAGSRIANSSVVRPQVVSPPPPPCEKTLEAPASLPPMRRRRLSKRRGFCAKSHSRVSNN
jgi:hypothetical protein